MIWHADEFSLHIIWRPRGGHDDKALPGFYLTAGVANEGEADYPLDNAMLSPDEFRAIIECVGSPVLSARALPLADEGRKRLEARHEFLLKQRNTIDSQLAAAKAALEESP